jgi:hypothetical protein
MPDGEEFVSEFDPLVGNGLLAEIAPELNSDVSNMPLLTGWKHKSAVLWFGGGSPLSHYDPWDNLFVQLAGRKRIVVYDPEYTSRFPMRSTITPRHQTNGKITGARAQGVPYYESWIEAGQAVLIPCGSLHALAGSWNSLSLSCFLSGGHRPRFRRHHYRYLAEFSLPREICSLIPRPFCSWLEQRFKYGTLSFWHGQRTAFPFAFPWTLARRLRTGRV